MQRQSSMLDRSSLHSHLVIDEEIMRRLCTKTASNSNNWNRVSTSMNNELVSTIVRRLVLLGLISSLMFKLRISLLESYHPLQQDHDHSYTAVRQLLHKNEQEVLQPYFSIDEFYTRSHTDYHQRPMEERPVLIIGGSDGSGTRAFAELVQKDLGVPMIYEDEGTLDVHAKFMMDGKGWTGLAELLLSYTHLALYNVTDLPDDIHQRAKNELQRFKDHYDAVAATKLSNTPNHSFFRYGFKAPISMVLLPLLKEVYHNIKFLHVIRDGRDISLSSNQSPVQKFYEHYYGLVESVQRRMRADRFVEGIGSTLHHENLLAMDLWNDWNLQVHEYSQSDATRSRETFDYIVVRTEDFLGTTTTKFATLAKIAKFSGSPLSDAELCSRSKRYVHQDLGRSDNHQHTSSVSEHEKSVSNRYGIWKSKLQNESEMLRELSAKGSRGLEMFGYEPVQSILSAEYKHICEN